ncbi:hypothetical protein V8B97DRAFT_2002761 [Scleroderma yunnanense]
MVQRSPNTTDGPKLNATEQYQRTITRIAQIQSHMENAPRSQRLKDKTCARHLYLLDFCPDHLPELESTIQQLYPDVKVTTIQADAADEAAIAAVCKRAIDEEGRLDVFFANAGILSSKALPDLTAEAFMESMRVNSLS